MLNTDQEDTIRNLLTIVVLYFQLEKKVMENPDDTEKANMLLSHKKGCQNAINRLISIMNIDGNLPLPIKEKPVPVTPVVSINKKDPLMEKIKMINNNSFF